jgi:dimethylglycine dehydrogenase
VPNGSAEPVRWRLDRLVPRRSAARVPALANCSIKDIVNGRSLQIRASHSSGRPGVGALNEGHSFGITAAGGAGWQLAEWIVEGEPGIDLLAVDPRRFGPYTGKRYLVTKNEETYRNVFTIHYPDEERADGDRQRRVRLRPAKHLGAGSTARLGAQLVCAGGRR